MSALPSSCEISGPVPAAGSSRSRVQRLGQDFRWKGVPVADYKQDAAGWAGVTRMVLAGGAGEKTAFQVRYFELAPGGFTSLERHAHEHVVVVLRGRGQVRLGEAQHELCFGDTVYVAPQETHQFCNASASEPFGFLCIVDAERDRPVPVARP